MSGGPEEIGEAVRRLRAGSVVAFPTETVYGLGADALNDVAVARVYELKGRPARNPLIVHVTDAGMASRVGVWTDDAQRLADRFWPGPLTLVLEKRDVVPDRVTAGADTLGVRAPDHPLTLALIDAFGGPLVGPSANPSGGVSPTTGEHVRASFSDEDVFVLDGGACRRGIESTVLTLADGDARVLRPGVIGADEIAGVLARPVASGPRSDDAGTVRSPGLLGRHYAPRGRVVLIDASDWPACRGPGERPERCAFLSRTILTDEPEVLLIRMPSDAGGYAARLFAALREADASGAGTIYVERPPDRADDGASDAVWKAVQDRLRRASQPA